MLAIVPVLILLQNQFGMRVSAQIGFRKQCREHA